MHMNVTLTNAKLSVINLLRRRRATSAGDFYPFENVTIHPGKASKQQGVGWIPVPWHFIAS